MGRSYGGRGKTFSKKYAKSKEDGEGGVFVQKKWYLGKDKLAAYADEDGCPFYLGDADDEKAFFGPGFIMSTRTSANEEYFHRLGMALSLGASSMHAGMQAVTQCIDPFWDESEDFSIKEKASDFKVKFNKSGLRFMADFAHTEDGDKLMNALQILNVGREGHRGQGTVEAAIVTLLEIFDKYGKDLRKHTSRVAAFSAKMYLASMSIIEHLELFENKKQWAKNMEDKAKTNKAVKTWTKDPKNEDLLVAALCESLMEKLKSHGKEKGKKRQAADSSDETDSNRPSSSDSDSDKDKEKKSKGKKKTQRRTASKNRSSSDTEHGKRNKRKS